MLIPRNLQDSLRPWLNHKEIIVILGARQVGKTSLLKLVERELKSTQPTFYLDLEDPFQLAACESLDKFLAYLSSQGMNPSKRSICFLDEIQYHPDPTKLLKLLHDHHGYIKIIASGSSTFEIRKKFKDSLVGRKVTFTLYPLSFREYLRFLGSEFETSKADLDLEKALENFSTANRYHVMTPKLMPIFEQFMQYGGYPAVALQTQSDFKHRLLQNIYASYLQKDIKDLARIDDPIKFNRLVAFLAVQVSRLYKTDEVAREVMLPKKLVQQYTFLLEQTFTLSLVRPFYSNLQKELTKMPKLYFLDNGLRNAVVEDFRSFEKRTDAGAVAEQTCFAELQKTERPFRRIHFWRTADGKEVDFVVTDEQKRTLAIEVKYRNNVKAEVPQPMKFFIRKYKPEHAVILTKNTCEQIRFNSTPVTFLPMWMM